VSESSGEVVGYDEACEMSAQLFLRFVMKAFDSGFFEISIRALDLAMVQGASAWSVSAWRRQRSERGNLSLLKTELDPGDDGTSVARRFIEFSSETWRSGELNVDELRLEPHRDRSEFAYECIGLLSTIEN
jgi:hypothetical protein